MTVWATLRNAAVFARTGRVPSRRAIATLSKLQGRRLERRWPFIPKTKPADLNLGFDDILEFEFARRRGLVVLVVGAYDGIANDPLARFVEAHACTVTYVEPQAAVFDRLVRNMSHLPNARFINAAIDERSGMRDLFFIPAGLDGLPEWTGQLASFDRTHLVKHEADAPGLTRHIRTSAIRTLSFEDLLEQAGLRQLDVLQIDAEGMDATLLALFPFKRLRPGVVHYEIAHMSKSQLERTRMHLRRHGYELVPDGNDETAVRL